MDSSLNPFELIWPAEHLETLEACPLCGDIRRSLLHGDLQDTAFGISPGVWSLWRCGGCRAAYLNPRPTVETIGRAYSNYYTHLAKGVNPELSTSPLIKNIRQLIGNGYTNKKFGTRRFPASVLGYYLISFLIRKKRKIDRIFRHLEVEANIKNRKLLDVGCGSGDFLVQAEKCGWSALGVDFDEKAITVARSRGATAYLGPIETLADQSGAFDVITLSHSLEHLHDPKAALNLCWKLLNPGGVLWIETPNIDSLGYQYFGGNWRGIEAPRHLVIFNKHSLTSALLDVGFNNVEWKRQDNLREGIFKSSEVLEANTRAASQPQQRPNLLLKRICSLFERDPVSSAEFLTVKCTRPLSK